MLTNEPYCKVLPVFLKKNVYHVSLCVWSWLTRCMYHASEHRLRPKT